MKYSEWIQGLKEQWVGKTVSYQGEQNKVVDVDYNGFLLIDKKAQFTNTTAIGRWMID